MSQDDFLEWLRDAAIKGNMPAQFIDQVDNLQTGVNAEDELYVANGTIDELTESLRQVVSHNRKGATPQIWDEALSAAELLLSEQEPK